MSSTPLLRVGVKDLLRQQLRNPLKPCMGLPLSWTFNSTKGGESRTWTRWAAKSHCALRSVEEASFNSGNTWRSCQYLCRDRMRVQAGGKSPAMTQGLSWFSCRNTGVFWLTLSWEGKVKEGALFLLLATCTGLGKQVAIILWQTQHIWITIWCSTPESVHQTAVLLES